MPTTPSDDDLGQARKVVVLALTKHDADSAQVPYDKLALLLRFGFTGFEHMENSLLLEAAKSRGLDRNHEVSRALGVIAFH